MAGSLNQVQLIGNLGGDPDIRRTQDGRPIANFSLATSNRWTDRTTGEKHERTEWHRVVIFSEKLAEICQQYLRKGSKIFVQGQLQTRKWADQTGVERWTTEVVLSGFDCQMLMLDSQRKGPPPPDDPDAYGTRSTVTGGASSPGGSGGAADRPLRDDLDDEIPF